RSCSANNGRILVSKNSIASGVADAAREVEGWEKQTALRTSAATDLKNLREHLDSRRMENRRSRSWCRRALITAPPELRDQLLHRVSMHIGEAEIATRMTEGQLREIEPEQVQNRCVQVVNVNGFFHGFETEFIRRTMDVAAAHAATCHPHRETVVIMIASVYFSGVCSGRG